VTEQVLTATNGEQTLRILAQDEARSPSVRWLWQYATVIMMLTTSLHPSDLVQAEQLAMPASSPSP